jgi:glycosyltransferase involved in cell wall biosynthesis
MSKIGGRRSSRSLALIVPAYPTATRKYGGQPIERRVRFYRAAGFDVTVVITPGTTEVEDDRDGVRVIQSRPEALMSVVQEVNPSQLCIHHPLPDQWNVAKELIDRQPVHLWIHGFEARDWRELQYNYTPQEMVDLAPQLDAITFERRETLREAFIESGVTKVFVSEFMKQTAESFAGLPSDNSLIIHNVIDTDTFAYDRKAASDRRKILSIRSFERRNYGTDLIRHTIELLSHEPFFDDLAFTIVGDGKHFDEDTGDLLGFSNVNVTRQFLDSQGMASAFKGHGIMLIPSRWDSQGMTMGEAMSAGLTPVTNAVAAIPEFADEECAVLAAPEDATGLADGIARLYRDPDVFLSMSEAAAERVRTQCGPQNTVQRELDLLEQAEATISNG